MTKIAGSGSGSISQKHGSEDPDPDPPQNVMDPEQWLNVRIGKFLTYVLVEFISHVDVGRLDGWEYQLSNP